MRPGRWLFVLAASLPACAGSLLCAHGAAAAGPAAVTEPVVVTATRIDTPLARTNRSVTVIGRDEIARSTARSVAELLEHVAGVDVRTRGPAGAQADVSIRGASFEETLVLVDGERVSDPQTGHHLLDLPLTLEDVERIEILRGQGSSLWGPNAFGGVVNIVTRRPAGSGLAVSAAAGEHRLLEARGSAEAATGPLRHRVSAERRTSQGWRHNTDLDITTLSWNAAPAPGLGGPVLSAGWTRKDFGANGFYGDRYPEQRETTDTFLLRGREELGGPAWSLVPSLSWRRHRDRYGLDRTATGPARYENLHTTDVFDGQLTYTLQTAAGATALGVEAGSEEIESNRLGTHARRRLGFSAEQTLRAGDAVDLRVGASAWDHEGTGWRFFPGADLGVRLLPGTSWFASVERAFRVPTYTELFYESPANQGNPDLVPEEAWSYETGLRGAPGPWRWDLAIFRRAGRDLIDWTRARPEDPWKAGNVSRLATDGLEAGLGWSAASAAAPLRSVRLDYAFLDTNRSAAGRESRYLLDHLRHQVVLEAEHRLPFGLGQRWSVAWEERLNGDDAFLVDTRIARSFGNFTVALEARNLLDASYAAIGGVPQPGRWVLLRLEWRLPPPAPAGAAAGLLE